MARLRGEVQAVKNKITRVFALLAACLFLCAFALSESYTVEEDGSKWYDDGHIEWADGTVTQQVDHDAGQSYDDDSGSGSAGVKNDDGSMTIVTGEDDPMAGATKNEDGSIEIESGTGGVDIDDSPTRAPLEGEEWEAALAGVAARNGTYTPTVWIDPATGTSCEAEVVYMGIGRSMVTVGGKKQLVNTVDLKWQTEAPEDKVLARVKSRYVWLHKAPSNDKKVLKFKQVYRDTVVRVLNTGKNWTFIDYGGYRAYVATNGLEFFANDHTDIEGGYLSLNGRINGKGIVQVRDPETMKILGQFKPGTPVTVFDILDDFGYAEIDVEGWHCVVMLECLTLERDLVSASDSV